MSQSSDLRRWVLSMTCQVRIIASDGSTTIARPMLDSASSTSFVMECLAQCLHLWRQYRHAQISGIGGITAYSGSCGVVDFKVSTTTHRGKVMAVEAVVLPKVPNNVQCTSVLFNNNWKHLLNLQLVDPNFSTSGSTDLILGADLFSHAVLYGGRLDHQDYPPCSRRLLDGSWLVPLTNTLASAPSSTCATDQRPSSGFAICHCCRLSNRTICLKPFGLARGMMRYYKIWTIIPDTYGFSNS